MISYSVLILVLLMKGCPGNKRAGPPYDPTSSPKSNGTNSTHISEFTDPATGLNPFLDLEEGGTGKEGRNPMGDGAPPRPLPDDFGLQLIEGDPSDRGSSRWDQGFDRRWGNFNNKPRYMSPMLPTTDVSPEERQNENRRYSQFGKTTEFDMKTEVSDFMPAARNSDDNDYYSLHPVEDNILDTDYNTESHKDEEETAETQDDIAHPKKVPISENVLISAAITGAAVAVIALLLAVCWWRQKMKRVSTQGNANITENDIESVISDKTNTNGDVQRKKCLGVIKSSCE